LSLAGFQVTLIGRFWVITEGAGKHCSRYTLRAHVSCPADRDTGAGHPFLWRHGKEAMSVTPTKSLFADVCRPYRRCVACACLVTKGSRTSSRIVNRVRSAFHPVKGPMRTR